MRLSPTQHIHNVSERIAPRSRRQTYRYACTSGQTWLTAARPETHQNLIHIANEHSTRATPCAQPKAPNSNITHPHAMGGRIMRRTETSPWLTPIANAQAEPHIQKDGAQNPTTKTWWRLSGSNR